MLRHPFRTLVIVGTGLLIYVAFFAVPAGPRTVREFDADQMAAFEVEVWKATDRDSSVDLIIAFTRMLHDEQRYTWARAFDAGYHLASATRTFAAVHSHYEQCVPDLEDAYTTARDWTDASFNPGAVARAEVAWWTAQRTARQSDPDIVGGLIADQYALFYEVPRQNVITAGILRARAAKLRADGGGDVDWTGVSALLRDSYRELHAALKSHRSRS